MVVFLLAGFWLYQSDKQDTILDNEYNKCLNNYTDNALPLQKYMQNCMN